MPLEIRIFVNRSVLVKTVCPVENSVDGILKALNFSGQIECLIHITWRIGCQISNSEAAIQVTTDQASYGSSFIAAFYYHAEHGCAIGLMDMVAPGTHLKARLLPTCG